ncbi:hypothetical protein BDY19DRAFT_989960 [Irpex rosettiformis]|uniref:Uncharacterized protein n=1 Tax=Irpex rosettiformis TaxID=378272 RepID=A0ACB8UHY4_9APHY|nr:hypothetical protein BDY19DRAFT_989960 [Irpex rosettiformis]
MSANKYASLPDIDTAPDVYETEDVFPTNQNNEDSSDDELGSYLQSHGRGRIGEGHAKPEELDSSSLNKEEASKKFRRAEKRKPRARIHYTYPSSPTSSGSDGESPSRRWTSTQKLSFAQRIQILKAEVVALEQEVHSQDERKELHEAQPNPAELIRELADVKARLSKVGTAGKKEAGRSKLVNAVLADGTGDPEAKVERKEVVTEKKTDIGGGDIMTFTAEIDRRLGALEKAIGSSTTALDETSPLLPPLIVTVTRLHSMLSLLSQPRQLDNVSRRLKLIQPDLERTSNTNTTTHGHQSASHGGQRRQSSGHPLHSTSTTNGASSPTVPSAPMNRTHLEQLSPILTRLAPILPNIPHILTRLRSLSALHTNAAAFQSTLERLEEQQAKERTDLADLEKAVEGIEKSIKDNESVVKKNVESLEARVEGVVHRIEEFRVNDNA